MNQVVLKNISLKTSGVYRCEITADPSFQAVSQQGDLIVVCEIIAITIIIITTIYFKGEKVSESELNFILKPLREPCPK